MIFWQLWAWEYKYLIFYQHQISPSTSLKFFDIWTWVIFCPPKSNSILNNEQIHSRASAHLMCCPRGYVGIRTAGNSAESVSRFGETWFCQIWQRWSAYWCEWQYVWVHLKIRVFFDRLEILVFLTVVSATFGCWLLDLIKQSFMQSCQKVLLGPPDPQSSAPAPFQKQLWTCEIEFLSLGCWVKEWLTIYYGTQSTGKNQPWNQTLWSWPLFLTFLIIRCFNLSCCVRSQFWKF